MFKYIAKQVEPEIADFDYVFDDDGLSPAGGDFNYTLFIFQDGECVFNKDIYSDYENEIEALGRTLDYIEEFESGNSLIVKPDWLEEDGFDVDMPTVELLDYCARCVNERNYPEALAAYLEAKTGKVWDTQGFSGYVQGDYCTLVYCKDFYDDAAINYYGNMWLGCGGEFAIGELEIPNVYADEIDFSDLDSFESWVDDWVYGCFVEDDIIWRGGDKLISKISDYTGYPKEDLEVYVYENGEYDHVE